MQRATKVIVVEGTPPVPRRKSAPKKAEPNILQEQKEALRLSPDSLVVDNSYPKENYAQSLAAAKAAMYVVNSGARKAWPSDTYYAIWRDAPEPSTVVDEGEEKPKVVQLLIGLRSHIKPEWEEIVNRAGSRKAKASGESKPDANDADKAPATDEDPFADDED